MLARQIAENRKLAAKNGGSDFANFSFVSGAERVAIRGLTDRPQLDGDESDFDMGRVEGGVNTELYPVSPKRLAEQQPAPRNTASNPGLPSRAACRRKHWRFSPCRRARRGVPFSTRPRERRLIPSRTRSGICLAEGHSLGTAQRDEHAPELISPAGLRA